MNKTKTKKMDVASNSIIIFIHDIINLLLFYISNLFLDKK